MTGEASAPATSLAAALLFEVDVDDGVDRAGVSEESLAFFTGDLLLLGRLGGWLTSEEISIPLLSAATTLPSLPSSASAFARSVVPARPRVAVSDRSACPSPGLSSASCRGEARLALMLDSTAVASCALSFSCVWKAKKHPRSSLLRDSQEWGGKSAHNLRAYRR